MSNEPKIAPLHKPATPGEADPTRPTTPDEDEGQDIAQLDDPPQAEGDRDHVSESNG